MALKSFCNISSVLWVVFSFLVFSVPDAGAQGSTPGFGDRSNFRGGNLPVFQHFQYDYSPTIMQDVDGKYRMWWCGRSPDPALDEDNIYYSESYSLSGNWSSPRVVFTPSHDPAKFDQNHTCDPSVILVRGVYYLYYGGAPLFGGHTEIGAAFSFDGINWARLNNGNAIVRPYIPVDGTYGAGQPSVVFVDPYFYMAYYDSTGRDGNLGYILRSKDPSFPLHATEEFSKNDGVRGFWPYHPSRKTNHALRQFINADLMYHGGLEMFMLSASLYLNEGTALFFSKDMLTEVGFTDVPGEWAEGNAFVRTPRGHAIFQPQNLYRSTCDVPIDLMRPVSKEGQGVSSWDIAWTGLDLHLSGNLSCGEGVRKVPLDYDGDGISDTAIYSTGLQDLYVVASSYPKVVPFDVPGAIPVAGDFDGDRVADPGTVRVLNGYLYWDIRLSRGGNKGLYWGIPGDTLCLADYDADGKDDICVRRGSEWYVLYDYGVRVLHFGDGNHIPVPGDYNGDGKDDVVAWHTTHATWSFQDSSISSVPIQWGLPGDIPVPGDYDFDGKVDLAVWRPWSGMWYIKSVSSGAVTAIQWGLLGDQPYVGDFNGDRRLDLVVWRPSDGNWYINYSWWYDGGAFPPAEWTAVHLGVSNDQLPQVRARVP